MNRCGNKQAYRVRLLVNREMQPATAKQQDYADKASYYVGRAMVCCEHELWPEAANHLGSALESLLRIRFGSGGKLATLVKRFDDDPFFNSVMIHDGISKHCTTCYADRARILRNSVHPDCWIEATQDDVDMSRILVVLLYHALISCQGQRIAIFQDSPDPTLKFVESSGYLSSDVSIERDPGSD
jgi:hypothetical protein